MQELNEPQPPLFDLPPPPVPAPPYTPARNRPGLLFLAYSGGFASGALVIAALWLVSSTRVQVRTEGAPRAVATVGRAKEWLKLPAAVSPTKPLSPADIAFGEKQVARMVRDRPEMLRDVKKGDPVWTYCVRAFGGASIGQRVYWDSTLPEDAQATAEHLGPAGDEKGYLRVRRVHAEDDQKGQPLSCEELWSCAVYELENIRNTPAFNRLYDLACQGKMTRDQWVGENTKLEYDACLRTAKLYRAIWKPMAEAKAIPSDGSNWFANVPGTYEEWIAAYTDPDSYPWSDWAKYYDDEIVPYLGGRTSR